MLLVFLGVGRSYVGGFWRFVGNLLDVFRGSFEIFGRFLEAAGGLRVFVGLLICLRVFS